VSTLPIWQPRNISEPAAAACSVDSSSCAAGCRCCGGSSTAASGSNVAHPASACCCCCGCMAGASQGAAACCGGLHRLRSDAMTEAAAVARAAEHLELEITRSRSDSMAGGAHNHAHFQVCALSSADGITAWIVTALQRVC
jgi:hypothetical protein